MKNLKFILLLLLLFIFNGCGGGSSGNNIPDPNPTVTNNTVKAEIRLSKEGQITLTELNKTVRLTAEYINPNGDEVKNAAFVWKSSNSSIVSVNNGLLELKSVGNPVTIRVTSNGVASRDLIVNTARIRENTFVVFIEPTELSGFKQLGNTNSFQVKATPKGISQIGNTKYIIVDDGVGFIGKIEKLEANNQVTLKQVFPHEVFAENTILRGQSYSGDIKFLLPQNQVITTSENNYLINLEKNLLNTQGVFNNFGFSCKDPEGNIIKQSGIIQAEIKAATIEISPSDYKPVEFEYELKIGSLSKPIKKLKYKMFGGLKYEINIGSASISANRSIEITCRTPPLFENPVGLKIPYVANANISVSSGIEMQFDLEAFKGTVEAKGPGYIGEIYYATGIECLGLSNCRNLNERELTSTRTLGSISKELNGAEFKFSIGMYIKGAATISALTLKKDGEFVSISPYLEPIAMKLKKLNLVKNIGYPPVEMETNIGIEANYGDIAETLTKLINNAIPGKREWLTLKGEIFDFKTTLLASPNIILDIPETIFVNKDNLINVTLRPRGILNSQFTFPSNWISKVVILTGPENNQNAKWTKPTAEILGNGSDNYQFRWKPNPELSNEKIKVIALVFPKIFPVMPFISEVESVSIQGNLTTPVTPTPIPLVPTINAKVNQNLITQGNWKTQVVYPTQNSYFPIGAAAKVNQNGSFSLDLSGITPPPNPVSLVSINPDPGVTITPSTTKGANFILVVFDDSNNNNQLNSGENLFLLEDPNNTFSTSSGLQLTYANRAYSLSGQSQTSNGAPVNWNGNAQKGWGRYIFKTINNNSAINVSYSNTLSGITYNPGQSLSVNFTEGGMSIAIEHPILPLQ